MNDTLTLPEPLRRIGLHPAIAGRLAAIPLPPHARLMRIVEAQRDVWTLHDGVREHRARALGGLLQRLQHDGAIPTVGDWVVVEADAHGVLWFVERIAPRNRIVRRANDGRRQPLVSNVDTALLAMGLDDDYNPRRLERTLALVAACGVEPVVLLTKADTVRHAQDAVAGLRERLPPGTPVIALDTRSVTDCDALFPWLAEGRTLVLLGASGTGKSTLANTLAGDALQATGGVRRGDGRGRHTTTARSLVTLPGGACLIDTPGLRTWQPDADAATLASAFEDIGALALQCRFRDCRHAGEPGCAVQAGIAPDRLLNFQKLLRDAQRAQRQLPEHAVRRGKWKRLRKAQGRVGE